MEIVICFVLIAVLGLMSFARIFPGIPKGFVVSDEVEKEVTSGHRLACVTVTLFILFLFAILNA